MIKKNKITLILTSLVTLIPFLAGLLLWDRLPEQVPSHWGIDGQVDGWSSKPMAVFLMPLILLAVLGGVWLGVYGFDYVTKELLKERVFFDPLAVKRIAVACSVVFCVPPLVVAVPICLPDLMKRK